MKRSLAVTLLATTMLFGCAKQPTMPDGPPPVSIGGPDAASPTPADPPAPVPPDTSPPSTQEPPNGVDLSPGTGNYAARCGTEPSSPDALRCDDPADSRESPQAVLINWGEVRKEEAGQEVRRVLSAPATIRIATNNAQSVVAQISAVTPVNQAAPDAIEARLISAGVFEVRLPKLPAEPIRVALLAQVAEGIPDSGRFTTMLGKRWKTLGVAVVVRHDATQDPRVTREQAAAAAHAKMPDSEIADAVLVRSPGKPATWRVEMVTPAGAPAAHVVVDATSGQVLEVSDPNQKRVEPRG